MNGLKMVVGEWEVKLKEESNRSKLKSALSLFLVGGKREAERQLQSEKVTNLLVK